LKEYVEKIEDSILWIPSSSFDDLKILIELVLNSIDLRNGADFISGKILLETSSLVARQPKRLEEEPEFVQMVIKPHKCWENTFFWQEYFWTQVTSKFSEKYGEGSKLGGWSSEEKEFFEKEIVDFAKVMQGWGDLPQEKLLLFLESLADACTLEADARDRVLTGVLQFQTKEQQRIKSGHRKSRLFGAQAGITAKRSSLAPVKESGGTPARPKLGLAAGTPKTPSPAPARPSTSSPSSRPKLTEASAGQGEPGATDVQVSKRKIQAKSVIINGEVNDFIAMLRRGTVSGSQPH